MQYLRCNRDATILAVVESAKGKFAVCPTCGSGAPLEAVLKQGAGLISDFLTEDQITSLQKDMAKTYNGDQEIR